MKKLYLLILTAAMALSANAFSPMGEMNTRRQTPVFDGQTVTVNRPALGKPLPKKVQSRVQMPQPMTAQEVQGAYIFSFMGFVGASIDLTLYTPGDISIAAVDDTNVSIGPFYWNVYFDGVFDRDTQTITLKAGQEKPIIGNPSPVNLTIYSLNDMTGAKEDVVLTIDAANHLISWESSSTVVEIAQVGRDVAAATIMGIYLDYANTYMSSYDVNARGGLEGPYMSLLWVEPTASGKIAVTNFCDAGALSTINLEVDNANRTASVTDGYYASELKLWQLDSAFSPVSSTVTFESGIYDADDMAGTEERLAVKNNGVGALTSDKKQGYKFADIQILMPYNPFTTGIEEVSSDNAEAEYYNLQGVRVANPEKGLYIERKGNNTRKVIL